MSTFQVTTQKQPMKVLEVPLNKFSEDVIPHHQEAFEQFKLKVMKHLSLGDSKELQHDMRMKQQTVKQLKDLMYELDTLRTQAENEDLDKFDGKTLSLRKVILNLISSYAELEKKVSAAAPPIEEIEANQHPFEGASQIQLKEDLEELRLKQRQQLYDEVKTINKNTEDLNEIYTQLHGMVHEQGSSVNHIEESTESTQKHVNSGYKSLIKAHGLKSSLYPVTGAVIGSLVGGPIGFLAGIKIGGLAALGCAVTGYMGGKIFKKSADKIETDNVDVNCCIKDEEYKKDI